jgi:hypothetical protein
MTAAAAALSSRTAPQNTKKNCITHVGPKQTWNAALCMAGEGDSAIGELHGCYQYCHHHGHQNSSSNLTKTRENG